MLFAASRLVPILRKFFFSGAIFAPFGSNRSHCVLLTNISRQSHLIPTQFSHDKMEKYSPIVEITALCSTKRREIVYIVIPDSGKGEEEKKILQLFKKSDAYYFTNFLSQSIIIELAMIGCIVFASLQFKSALASRRTIS